MDLSHLDFLVLTGTPEIMDICRVLGMANEDLTRCCDFQQVNITAAPSNLAENNLILGHSYSLSPSAFPLLTPYSCPSSALEGLKKTKKIHVFVKSFFFFFTPDWEKGKKASCNMKEPFCFSHICSILRRLSWLKTLWPSNSRFPLAGHDQTEVSEADRMPRITSKLAAEVEASMVWRGFFGANSPRGLRNCLRILSHLKRLWHVRTHRKVFLQCIIYCFSVFI